MMELSYRVRFASRNAFLANIAIIRASDMIALLFIVYCFLFNTCFERSRTHTAIPKPNTLLPSQERATFVHAELTLWRDIRHQLTLPRVGCRCQLYKASRNRIGVHTGQPLMPSYLIAKPSCSVGKIVLRAFSEWIVG